MFTHVLLNTTQSPKYDATVGSFFESKNLIVGGDAIEPALINCTTQILGGDAMIETTVGVVASMFILGGDAIMDNTLYASPPNTILGGDAIMDSIFAFSP